MSILTYIMRIRDRMISMQSYSELLKTLLEKRGIKSKEEAEIFLNPSYERDFLDPFSMRDMKIACERIFHAILSDEKILIYADYDCDGIPGAVILSDFFEKIGFKNYEVYIPQRNGEGYGLNKSAIEVFIKDKVKLLITIDLGITATEETEYANENGIDIIITDHHLPKSDLPKATAILNPKIDDYKEKMLCGAGVVFKLIQGLVSCMGKEERFKSLEKNIGDGWEKWLLDMAGLATLSDMVPLVGENRAIAYFGMKVLKKSRRIGLQKLLEKMKIVQKYLSPDDVSYMITPKINVASRMDDPVLAYKLLSTRDTAEAGRIADYLFKINDERKSMVTSIMREVNKIIEKRELNGDLKDVLVVGNPKWRVGVLGLVAGKISEEYEKPVFVWGTDENDCIRGSCRSDGSVSVVTLMSEVKESFIEFGGHEMAGGFSVISEQIHFLEEKLSTAFQKVKKEKEVTSAIYDMKMTLSDVNKRSWRDIEKMEPFGLGNEKPVFLFENVKIEKIKKFGKNGGEHLEIIFIDASGSKINGISFFSNEESFSAHLFVNAYVNLLASFDLSRFKGKEEIRLRIVDIF